MAALQDLLASDVVVHADGGGKRPAALRPIVGLAEVLALHGALARRYGGSPSELVRYAMINGLPGFVTREADGLLQTTALELRDGRIVGVYVMRNPDKLERVTGA